MLCRASPCCVLCCTSTSSYIYASNIRSIIPRTGTNSATYTRFVHNMFCTWHEVSLAEISPSTPPQRNSLAAQRRAVPCPAMPCRALQLSSVANRSASSAERGAVCFAVLRHAACFAVLLLVRTYMPVTFEVSYQVPVMLMPHTPDLFVHITLLDHEQCTPSSGQPGYI